MTWTAPPVTRIWPPDMGDERTMLDAFLEFHRQTLLMKCAGLTAGQLKRRSAEPSRLSLLGLVRHLAEVESSWFRRRFGRQDFPFLFSSEENPDGEFDDAQEADAEQDYATYLREVELARAAVAGHSLDETFVHPLRQAEMDLRWVYLHLIEEYARHNGHADLLRERIDGVTGQ